jgi:hypothetical protein
MKLCFRNTATGSLLSEVDTGSQVRSRRCKRGEAKKGTRAEEVSYHRSATSFGPRTRTSSSRLMASRRDRLKTKVRSRSFSKTHRKHQLRSNITLDSLHLYAFDPACVIRR